MASSTNFFYLYRYRRSGVPHDKQDSFASIYMQAAPIIWVTLARVAWGLPAIKGLSMLLSFPPGLQPRGLPPSLFSLLRPYSVRLSDSGCCWWWHFSWSRLVYQALCRLPFTLCWFCVLRLPNLQMFPLA